MERIECRKEAYPRKRYSGRDQEAIRVIVGDPSVFAIESGITVAYERLSFRALGFFVLHIAGQRYGVHEPDASMLANSYEEVAERISRRTTHTARFAKEDAGQIADAVSLALYGDYSPADTFFEHTHAEFARIVHSNHLLWAPDGDEAFDDGSYVIHFDIGHQVRLIAFRRLESGAHDPATIADLWLSEDVMYSVLLDWRNRFHAEWASTPRVVD